MPSTTAGISPQEQSQVQQHGPMATMNINTNIPSSTPLRRAVYIHVSDLTSAYNIDHVRLEDELQRANLKREADLGNPQNRPAAQPEQQPQQSSIPTDVVDTSSSTRKLQAPRGGYNLCVLVGRVVLVVDKHRVDGSRVRLAEVEVGDETGTVSLRARDDQIDILQTVSERSGAVVMRNCTLELYQGKHIRLAITKWGKLSVYPDQVASTPPPPSKMNKDRNFSMIDLSVVASELVSYPPQTEAYRGSSTVNATESGNSRALGNRGSSYQASPPPQQRSNRRSSRGKQVASSNVPVGGTGSGGPAHYGDTGMRYSGGMHSPYGGYNEGMHFAPYPSHHQQEQQQQQHMMMQQQYEIQHQMQQHMYLSNQDRQRTMQSTSPMLVPTMPGTRSFDTNFNPIGNGLQGARGMIGPSGAFPLSMQHQPQGVAMQQQQQRRSHPSGMHQRMPRSTSPGSPGKMNPQAATFDPAFQQPHGEDK